MKKIYIVPATEVVALNVEKMMALSTSETSAQQSAGMDTKGSGDWNIWE